jgi:hypothetical protein
MDHNQQECSRGGMSYIIKVRGMLDEAWLDWFDNIAMSYDEVGTILTGMLDDQASLRGILTRIWDLSLEVRMISVISQTEIQGEVRSGGE